MLLKLRMADAIKNFENTFSMFHGDYMYDAARYMRLTTPIVETGQTP